MSLQQDNQIIQRILEGNIREYAVLVDKYKNLAFTLAFRILNNREDAEEVAQDAFVKAYRNLSGFRSESAFSTWLYRIVFNTAISKKRIKRPFSESVENNSKANDISEWPKYDFDIINERSGMLNKAMQQLADEDRVILTLYYLNESSIDEIQNVTGYSKSNVKVKLFRARKKLQDLIGEMSVKTYD